MSATAIAAKRGARAVPLPPRVLKLLGALLDYPREDLWAHRDELLTACHDAGLPKAVAARLHGFTAELLAMAPMDAQERWLALFDRGRAMSLLLFEHIHGESRDRGQAMVDLVETYRRNGFELAARELPDYLPLVLEYLAQRSSAESSDWLDHIAHILGLLAARAAERESPYALLLDLLAGSEHALSANSSLRERARAEARDDTPEAMDKVWEEEAVRFGNEAPSDDCQPNRPAAARPTPR